MPLDLVLAAYSFGDSVGQLSGPGGTCPMGMGSGSADEGIDFEQSEDKNRKTVGAGGSVMHTLIMDDSGKARIHCLKTSPINGILNTMYTYQKQSTLFWGRNLLTFSNPILGDTYTCSQVAFTRRPSNSYSKDPNQLVWEFDIGNIFAILGARLV